MSNHEIRKEQIATLRAALSEASNEYLSVVRTGNMFGPEYQQVSKKQKQAYEQLRNFLIPAPGRIDVVEKLCCDQHGLDDPLTSERGNSIAGHVHRLPMVVRAFGISGE
jgi:hypothetical protein